MSQRSPPSIRTLIATFLFIIPTLAQTTYVQGTFQAAITASTDQSQDLTSAAGAVCPANFPNSCSSIGEAGFCCPTGSFCQYASNQQVGCCHALSGTCSGSLSGGNAYQPTSQYVQPATTQTTWQQPQNTPDNGNAGGAVVVGNNNPTTTIIQQGGFCTTLVAEGNNLPTTANARCGTALVVEAGASKGRGGVVGVVLGLQVVGAWVVLRRW